MIVNTVEIFTTRICRIKTGSHKEGSVISTPILNSIQVNLTPQIHERYYRVGNKYVFDDLTQLGTYYI